MSEDILDWTVNDPRGEKLLVALAGQDLSNLSREDLAERVAALQAEVARSQAAFDNKSGAVSAAEALFKS